MYLVHEKKGQSGKWEVAWTWLPFFLASDKNLHRYVGQKMTETFKGQIVEISDILISQMHHEVIRLILVKYPIAGLRQYLQATLRLQPEESMEES